MPCLAHLSRLHLAWTSPRAPVAQAMECGGSGPDGNDRASIAMFVLVPQHILTAHRWRRCCCCSLAAVGAAEIGLGYAA